MWIAKQWKEYEVIDTGRGEKLERWGEYLLIRPDPQVIWESQREHSGWRNRNGHYHRSAKGGGEWEFFGLPQEWSIHYGQLTFRLKPFSFKHTGLFPEQAVNWDWFSDLISRAGRPLKVLNLFAYTGGATLSAAQAGAHVTHVDASKGMVNWAKKTLPRPAFPMPQSVGWWTTASNSWKESCAGEIPMTVSSWILHPMAEDPRAKSGKSKKISSLSYSYAPDCFPPMPASSSSIPIPQGCSLPFFPT